MKILVTGPIHYNYSQSIVNSLRQLGHDVMFVKMVEFYRQCTYLERKLYKLGLKSLDTNHTEKWNKDFIEVCHNFQPDMVFTLNGFMLESTTLQQLKDAGIKLIIWLIDSIKRLKDQEGKLGYYNKVYCFEEDDVPYLQDKYGLNPYYCPVGFEEDVYFPDAAINRDIDICFVGAPSEKRLEILQPVAKYIWHNSLTMKVCGEWWDKKYFWKKAKFSRKYAPLDEYIFNSLVDAPQVADLYRRSKICLNIHTPEHNGINPRTFEILGTRSFEFMDERKKATGLIRPGIDVVMYTNANDLLNKIDYYLANEQEREGIANNGYDWVKSRYTIKQMVKNIITG